MCLTLEIKKFFLHFQLPWENSDFCKIKSYACFMIVVMIMLVVMVIIMMLMMLISHFNKYISVFWNFNNLYVWSLLWSLVDKSYFVCCKHKFKKCNALISLTNYNADLWKFVCIGKCNIGKYFKLLLALLISVKCFAILELLVKFKLEIILAFIGKEVLYKIKTI